MLIINKSTVEIFHEFLSTAETFFNIPATNFKNRELRDYQFFQDHFTTKLAVANSITIADTLELITGLRDLIKNLIQVEKQLHSTGRQLQQFTALNYCKKLQAQSCNLKDHLWQLILVKK